MGADIRTLSNASMLAADIQAGVAKPAIWGECSDCGRPFGSLLGHMKTCGVRIKGLPMPVRSYPYGRDRVGMLTVHPESTQFRMMREGTW